MDGNFQYGWEPLKNRMFAEANGAVCNTLITGPNPVVASIKNHQVMVLFICMNISNISYHIKREKENYAEE